MPKGVYERNEAQKQHARTVNIGRAPWNKGEKGVQKAWNKGLEFKQIQGEKNPRWSGGLSRLARNEASAGRPRPENCEVCYRTTRLDFDHCHQVGHFRGWICRRCNLVLGMVKDDQTLLRNLAKYLDNSYPETRPERLMDALLANYGDVQDSPA